MDEITCPQGHADQGAEGAKSRNQYISLCFPQRAWNLAAAILSSWSSALTERHGGSCKYTTAPPALLGFITSPGEPRATGARAKAKPEPAASNRGSLGRCEWLLPFSGPSLHPNRDLRLSIHLFSFSLSNSHMPPKGMSCCGFHEM